MSERRGSNTRLVVVVSLILLLFIQGIASFRTSPEPYPTVRMPGFGTAPNREGIFTMNQETISLGYSDGHVVDVTAQDLMSDFRYSSARPSVNYMFKPKKDGTPPDVDENVVDWLRLRAQDLGDGSMPQYIEFSWQPIKVDVRDVGITSDGDPQITRIEL